MGRSVRAVKNGGRVLLFLSTCVLQLFVAVNLEMMDIKSWDYGTRGFVDFFVLFFSGGPWTIVCRDHHCAPCDDYEMDHVC